MLLTNYDYFFVNGREVLDAIVGDNALSSKLMLTRLFHSGTHVLTLNSSAKI